MSWAAAWPLARLGDLGAAEPNAITDGPFGSNLKSSDYVEGGGVRVIRLGNIGVGEFVDVDRAFVSKQKGASLAKHEARAGDLVIAALAEPVGRAVIVPEHIGPAIVKADCVRFRPGPAIDPRFLLHALNSPIGLRQTEDVAHGIGRLRINLGELRELEVPAPPLDEQRRIVARLDALRARSRRAKDALDTVPALLDRLRQSILAAAFRGDLTADWRAKNPDVEPASELLKRIRIERKKRWEEAEVAKLVAKGKPPTDDRWKSKYVEPEPVDETDLPDLPDTWCWASGQDLFAFVTSGSRGWAEHYGVEGAPFLRVGNTRRSDIALDLADLQRVEPPEGAEGVRTLAQADDLVVSITADIGRVGRVPDGLGEAYISQHLALVRLANPTLSSHVGHWLISPMGQRLLGMRDRGMTKAGLGLDDVRGVPVPLPPAAEIGGLVVAIRCAVEGCRLRVEPSILRGAPETLDAAILGAAFRGELQDCQLLESADVSTPTP